jgi:hypothetical protein
MVFLKLPSCRNSNHRISMKSLRFLTVAETTLNKMPCKFKSGEWNLHDTFKHASALKRYILPLTTALTGCGSRQFAHHVAPNKHVQCRRGAEWILTFMAKPNSVVYMVALATLRPKQMA